MVVVEFFWEILGVYFFYTGDLCISLNLKL